MATLVWGAVGERVYETGADRGVLYVGSNPGVAWSGLRAVKESPSGGEPTPYYLDGFKYLNVSAAEEFKASIEAYSAPREFDQCDGTVALAQGLFATQQPRVPFGFSYRTMVGNDVEGVEHGYKIHLVYGAMASPATRDNSTINASPEPINFNWAIETVPPMATGYKPTAHFVVDSRLTPEPIMRDIEDIIYGTPTTPPTLIDIPTIMEMFDNWAPFVVTDVGDGTYLASGYRVVEAVPGVSFTMDYDTIDDHGDGSFTINY